MRMDLGLTQTIKQIQTLSPQMYMSMEILCLNSLDLEDRIETELEENVALELSEKVKEDDREGMVDSGSPEGEEGGPPDVAAPPVETDTEESTDEFDRKVEQWDRYAREEYDFRSGLRSSYDDEKDEKFEALNNTEGRPMSLQEYLEQQVHLLSGEILGENPEILIKLCVAIIYNIDDRGYLMYPPEEIYQSLLEECKKREEKVPPIQSKPAGTVDGQTEVPGGSEGNPREGAQLGEAASPSPPPVQEVQESPAGKELEEFQKFDQPPSRELFQRALEIVQSLEPPGVGGQDLKECLLLQLKRDVQTYPVETQIIENHLDDLANNRLPKIAKALGISVDDVKVSADTIASLNPIPGKLFGGQPPRFIRPDVVVEEVNGHYEVRVDTESVPRLQVSSYYRELYRNSVKDAELKKFIKKKLESAEWLISAIRQRQSTLQRIAEEIVEIQKGFLDHGISHLQPLKMVDVADRVGVHVSTISRAISGKYIQTPRGIFELKFFFTGGAMKTDGTMEARGSVIQRIKDLIASEDKRNPFSDIDIVKKLEGYDIKISRRTVTKYREAENIPSSRQRRAY